MWSLVLVCALAQTPELVADAGVPVVSPPPLPALEVDAGTPVAAPLVGRHVRVKLKDGQQLQGVVAAQLADGTIGLTLASGGALTLPAESIAEVREVDAEEKAPGEAWFSDPNRTRYLYGPSAMMLKRNELSFSQTELLLSTLGWGITDWLSLQVGGAVPIWFVPTIPQNFNLLLSLKAGGTIVDKFSLAGGVQGLWLPGLTSGTQTSLPIVGLAFVSATYGTTDYHATLSVALPFSSFTGLVSGSPIFTLSGNVRVARSVALVTENWVILAQASTLGGGSTTLVTSAHGLAARIMGEKFAADLGFVVAQSSGTFVPIPIPWVNFTYNFGTP